MTSRSVALVLAALGFLSTQASCASAEYRAYQKAEDDYERCLVENPSDSESCNVLEDAVRRRYDEYERSARQRLRDHDNE